MQLTQQEASKLLKKFEEEKSTLISIESMSSTFNAASTEDVEKLRPEYDYKKTQEDIIAIDTKIRKIKHALNIFNTTVQVPGFDMTIDQMLIYIPQLNLRKRKLANMQSKLPRQRNFGHSMSNIIDYVYTNYDIDRVKADFIEVSDTLAKAQIALDTVNSSTMLEIDL